MAAGSSTHGSANFALLLAERNRYNESALTWYALALAGLMAVFILFNQARVVGHGARFRFRAGGIAVRIARPFLFASRVVRNISVRRLRFFPSVGHAVLVFIYTGLNVVFSLVNFSPQGAFSVLSNVGSRTGWMATGNTALLVLFAMRNTPFAFLSAWSYERLNYLHQAVGYATLTHVVVHTAAYTRHFCHATSNCARMSERTEIYGGVAGASFLAVVLAGALVRRWWYEAFYYTHITFWIVALVFAGLHQPSPAKNVWKVIALCAALWVLDHSLRVLRILAAGIGNSATVWPLANGGTRVVFKNGPATASAGQHAFVWLPRVRLLETHPFTVTALNPAEFVVAPYDGFTKDLHRFAARNPGAELRGSLDGPYGALPDMDVFDRVVLVAGGSGASFAFGRALHMLAGGGQGRRSREQTLVLVWAVRDSSYFSWFANHLETLRRHPNVVIRLFVTGADAEKPRIPSTTTTITIATPAGITVPPAALHRNRTGSSASSSTFETSLSTVESALSSPIDKEIGDKDLERGMYTPTAAVETTPPPSGPPTAAIETIETGRPDIAAIIGDAVADTPPDGRLLVMGCGPRGLMDAVRGAAPIRSGGPGIEVHCEGFGW